MFSARQSFSLGIKMTCVKMKSSTDVSETIDSPQTTQQTDVSTVFKYERNCWLHWPLIVVSYRKCLCFPPASFPRCARAFSLESLTSPNICDNVMFHKQQSQQSSELLWAWKQVRMFVDGGALTCILNAPFHRVPATWWVSSQVRVPLRRAHSMSRYWPPHPTWTW